MKVPVRIDNVMREPLETLVILNASKMSKVEIYTHEPTVNK